MGALWETIGFAIHAAGSRDQQQIAYATAWNVLFLLAPLWINAFAYMTFARMVHFYLPGGKVAGFRAGGIARWFVLADVVSFVVQAAGGIMASPSSSQEIVRVGLDIYLGGMGLQQGCILVFVGLMWAFQRRCGREGVMGDGKRSWKPLLFALYGVLVCITVSLPLNTPNCIHLLTLASTDPHHLPHRRVRGRRYPQQSGPLPRAVHLRPRLLPHDACPTHPGRVAPGAVPGRARQRVPPAVEEGEEGEEEGSEGGCKGGEGSEEAGKERRQRREEGGWQQWG